MNTFSTQQTSGTTAPLADQPVSDFDGDGISDILWHNTNGQSAIWDMSPTGGITPVVFGPSPTSWIPQATGDFNTDGKADILWRNTSGEVSEWLSNGGTGTAAFTSVDLGNIDASWAIQGTGDFSGDGASDILWRNTNGDTTIWHNNEDGTFTSEDLGVIDPSWGIQRVGDFNADGKADILWRNANGEVTEWLSNGGTGLSGFTSVVLGNIDSSWVTQGVGDFNGDHTSDILWRNTVTGDTTMWVMNSNGVPTSQDLGVIALSWTIQGVGDFNGDGKADILWRNSNGQVSEWLSNAGAGFTGFTSVLLSNVDPSWSVVGANLPATPTPTASVVAMAHAMAATGADSSGPALVSASGHDTSTHPMIAAPALKFA